MTAQTAADLRAAADVLARDGWTQGHYGSPFGGYCLVGALDRVVVERHTPPAVEDRMYELIRTVTGTHNEISWNDEPGRTADEVIAALRAAADAAEAQS